MRPRLGEPDRTWPLMKADFCETDLKGIRYGSRYGTRVITSSFGDWDLRPGLASLRVPLLVMHGEEETIPMDLVEEWITAMPKGMATLIKVPRAAHFVYLERPEIVWPAVEKFLSANDTQPELTREPPGAVARSVKCRVGQTCAAGVTSSIRDDERRVRVGARARVGSNRRRPSL